jgi:hypothetical protein
MHGPAGVHSGHGIYLRTFRLAIQLQYSQAEKEESNNTSARGAGPE